RVCSNVDRPTTILIEQPVRRDSTVRQAKQDANRSNPQRCWKGAMTMMYSVIYNVMLNPFPYTDPRRMVDLVIRNNADGRTQGGMMSVEFSGLVDESGVFEDGVGA